MPLFIATCVNYQLYQGHFPQSNFYSGRGKDPETAHYATMLCTTQWALCKHLMQHVYCCKYVSWSGVS